MKRAVFIDIAKAICIVLVVIGHADSQSFPQWYRTIILGIYAFHMPLFMFASGYLYAMTRKNEPYSIFILKKVRRLIIPYFFCSFIILSIKLLLQSFYFHNNQISFHSFLCVFYKPEAGYFLWFIWALWWIFIIVPFFKTKYQRLFLLFLVIILHFYPLPYISIFSITPTKYMFMYFMIGVVVFDFKNLSFFFKKIHIYVYAFLFVILECVFFKSEQTNLLLKACVAVGGIAFIIALSLKLEKLNNNVLKKAFDILSRASYIIFLLHTTFEGLAKLIINKCTVYGCSLMDFFCVKVLFMVGFGMMIPIILYQTIIIKYKFTKLLFGLK